MQPHAAPPVFLPQPCRTAQIAAVPSTATKAGGAGGFSFAQKRSCDHSSSLAYGQHSPQLSLTHSACKGNRAACNSPSPEYSKPCRPLQSRAQSLAHNSRCHRFRRHTIGRRSAIIITMSGHPPPLPSCDDFEVAVICALGPEGKRWRLCLTKFGKMPAKSERSRLIKTRETRSG